MMRTPLVLLALLLSLLSACGGPLSDSAGQSAEAIQPKHHDGPTVQDLVASIRRTGDVSQPAPTPEPAEATSGDARKWTAPDGKLLAVGELIDLMEDGVCLLKPDGQGMVIPLAELCDADQRYVREQVGEMAAPPRATEEAAAEPAALPEHGMAAPEAAPHEEALAQLVPRSQQIVIPFDFQSKFDDGRYGQMVSDMIWKKLQREGGFIIPETMLDVRGTCQSNNIHPTPQTAMAQMKKYVREDFGAHVGIWGSVERVAGHEWEVYDLTVKCVDFNAYPEPRVIYEKTARTNSVSEIPHLYIKEMLDALYDRKPGEPPPPDPIAEKNWLEKPNLVVGDFQQGSAGAPTGWASEWQAGDVGGPEPLGTTIRWVGESGNTANRLIRFTFGAGLGDSTGVAYYSDAFPVQEGARYRFQCRYRSNGPKIIVFIKCYDQLGTTYRTETERPAASPGDSAGYIPEISQLREVYRSQQNLKGPKNTWNTQTEDFTPKHTKYTPRWGRVMLYSYLGAGVVEFDDVVLKQILSASAGEQIKTRRHSLETKVTIEEMQENERRSREGQQP